MKIVVAVIIVLVVGLGALYVSKKNEQTRARESELNNVFDQAAQDSGVAGTGNQPAAPAEYLRE